MPRTTESDKRVLVTGGCGFLGSLLCDQLLLRSDIALLVCVDNLWTGLEKNVVHIRDARFKTAICDVEEFRSEWCQGRADSPAVCGVEVHAVAAARGRGDGTRVEQRRARQLRDLAVYRGQQLSFVRTRRDQGEFR